MLKTMLQTSEIVSLAVMLLMVIALVAAQADDKVPDLAPVDPVSVTPAAQSADTPVRTSISAHVEGLPLTISIDAVAEFGHFRLDDE